MIKICNFVGVLIQSSWNLCNVINAVKHVTSGHGTPFRIATSFVRFGIIQHCNVLVDREKNVHHRYYS